MIRRKRGPYRKRSPEEVINLLYAGVGQVLRDKGYEALSAEAISVASGVSRKLIKIHFGGKAALIRSFLLANDFWLPSLKAVVIPSSPKSADILRLFVLLLQEQFRYFLAKPELRKVILAQISAHDALMQTINTMRETEGNRVIAMADAHFRDSGIDINWVIGLAMGGGYFYGLQGDTRNGPACNRDTSNERDVEAGLRTMGQMLELFWWAADRVKKEKLQHRYFRLLHPEK